MERIAVATISPWPRGRVPKRFEHYELKDEFDILSKWACHTRTMTNTPVAVPSGTVAPKERGPQSMFYRAGIPVLVVVAIYFLPTPAGVDPQGLHMLGIFVGTIVALILQPLPTGSVALIGLAVAMITRTQIPADALSGFSNATIWLIVASFFIAQLSLI